MSKTKLLITAVVSLVVMNLCLVAFIYFNAPGGPRGLDRPGPGRGHEGVKDMIVERLALDSQQQDAYSELIKKHRATILDLEEILKSTKNELFLNLNSEDPVRKIVLMNTLNETNANIENAHYEHFMELKKICKPEQALKFEALTKDISQIFSGPESKPPPR